MQYAAATGVVTDRLMGIGITEGQIGFCVKSRARGLVKQPSFIDRLSGSSPNTRVNNKYVFKPAFQTLFLGSFFGDHRSGDDG